MSKTDRWKIHTYMPSNLKIPGASISHLRTSWCMPMTCQCHGAVWSVHMFTRLFQYLSIATLAFELWPQKSIGYHSEHVCQVWWQCTLMYRSVPIVFVMSKCDRCTDWQSGSVAIFHLQRVEQGKQTFCKYCFSNTCPLLAPTNSKEA